MKKLVLGFRWLLLAASYLSVAAYFANYWGERECVLAFAGPTAAVIAFATLAPTHKRAVAWATFGLALALSLAALPYGQYGTRTWIGDWRMSACLAIGGFAGLLAAFQIWREAA